MPAILNTHELSERLDPIIGRAGLFPLSALQQLSPDLERFRQELSRELPAVWFGAPWGSWSFFGVHQADQLNETSVARFMDRIFEIGRGLFSSEEQWVFHTGSATLSGRGPLGVFGRVLFVWESMPQVTISQVQRAKRSTSFGRCCIVPWVVVLPERRVYGHKGLPFTMGAPVVRDIQRLLGE